MLKLRISCRTMPSAERAEFVPNNGGEFLRADNETSWRSDITNGCRNSRTVRIVRGVIAIHSAGRHAVDHGAEETNRQAINYGQLRGGELSIRHSLTQDDENIA